MTEPILQFFRFEHLPPELAEVSRSFHMLATIVEGTLPRNAERAEALRKLLEAKDAAVRARLFKDVMPTEPEAPTTLDLRRINENQLAQEGRLQKLEEFVAEAQKKLARLEARTAIYAGDTGHGGLTYGGGGPA